MLADIRYWENNATNKHYAIAHFNVWNAEMLMGVIDAAEEAKSPVIISFGTGFVGNTSFEDFSHMMVSMAKKATVPVITHWDHGRSMEIIHNAWTHALGIPVEAELGHVGNETVYEEALAGYHYTDPYQAAEFVERTAVSYKTGLQRLPSRHTDSDYQKLHLQKPLTNLPGSFF